jgi:hypothetical protein
MVCVLGLLSVAITAIVALTMVLQPKPTNSAATDGKNDESYTFRHTLLKVVQNCRCMLGSRAVF